MKIAVFVFMFLVVLQSSASELKSIEDTLTLSNNIIEDFVSKKFEAGINRVKPHWPLPVVEMDNLLNTIQQQWPIVDQRFGQAVGKEFLYSESIGGSFVRHYYLHKFYINEWEITENGKKDEPAGATVKTLMSVPIKHQDELLGELALFSFDSNAFKNNKKTLELLTGDFSTLLDLLLLYEKNRLLSITDGLTKVYTHR